MPPPRPRSRLSRTTMNPRLSPGLFELTNGLCALIASLLIWRITGSWIGWVVLWTPGAYLVFIGLWKVLRD